jgi:hypothetical protein
LNELFAALAEPRKTYIFFTYFRKNTGIFRCFFQDFRYKYRFLPESKSSNKV